MPPRRRWQRDLAPLSRGLSRFRPRGRAGGELAHLQDVWREIVGEDAARHAVVVRRSRAGVMSIACSSAAWAQELDTERDRWTEEFLRRLPDSGVRALRFFVGDHVIPDADPQPRRAITPTAQEMADADAHTPATADPVLRDLLVRAQAGQKALERERKRLQIAEKRQPDSRWH